MVINLTTICYYIKMDITVPLSGLATLVITRSANRMILQAVIAIKSLEMVEELRWTSLHLIDFYWITPPNIWNWIIYLLHVFWLWKHITYIDIPIYPFLEAYICNIRASILFKASRSSARHQRPLTSSDPDSQADPSQSCWEVSPKKGRGAMVNKKKRSAKREPLHGSLWHLLLLKITGKLELLSNNPLHWS